MVKLNKISKVLLACALTLFTFIIFIIISWILILPFMVSNVKLVSYVENIAEKNLGAQIEIVDPKLSTSLSPKMGFKLKKLKITHGQECVADIVNLDSEFSFSKVSISTLFKDISPVLPI